MAAQSSPLLELQGISKHFGPVAANKDISCAFRSGTVHALLGENGAGKSTLMSILAGRFQPDGGRILLDGRPSAFSSPAQALAAGIGMVYQRFMLIPTLTVAENIVLGAPGGDSMAKQRKAIRNLSREYGLEVEPDARVFQLSMGQRQRVEILKLLYRGAKVLIFDEPTAVLTPSEIESLFTVLKQLKKEGRTIIFITHKLDEVMAVADAISVLRRGRLVAGMNVDQVRSRQELARLMVGREVILNLDKPAVEPGRSVLRVRGLTGKNLQGRTTFENISLEIRQGEILAVIGVAGNGQEDLVQCLAGLAPAAAGSIRYLDSDIPLGKWGRLARRSVAYVPEDRYATGSVRAMSLTENFILTSHQAYGPGPVLNRRQAREASLRALEEFQIKATSPADRAGQLSGGNLQKLILARELGRKPDLLLAEQPTQGLDVRAAEDVWRTILAQRLHGAILLVSGDLREVLSLADRIAVMFRGRILETIDAADEQGLSRIKLLMAGVRSEDGSA